MPINLDPLSNIGFQEALAIRMQRRFQWLTDRWGKAVQHRRVTRATSQGSTTSFTTTVDQSIKVFVFDRQYSSMISQSGIQGEIELDGQPRAYVLGTIDVQAGDYLMTEYVSGDGSYEKKYEVLVMSRHEIGSDTIFKRLTLRLTKD